MLFKQLTINQITVGLKIGSVNIRYSRNNTQKLQSNMSCKKEFLVVQKFQAFALQFLEILFPIFESRGIE